MRVLKKKKKQILCSNLYNYSIKEGKWTLK